VNVKIGPSAEEDEDNAESHKTETTTLKWQQNIQSALNSAENKNRSRLISGRLKNQKSHRTKVVEKIQQDHKNHRQKAIDQIKKKQSTRRSSLIQKVAARKKVKHSKALLKSIYFSSLEEASISKIIDAMEFVALDQNDNSDICRQGDVADTFYIIISGACQVTIDGRPITLLGALDIFGEIALFTGANGQSVRSATVTKMVDKDLQLLTLSRAKFNALIASGTLNKDCMAKLKMVAGQRQKVHMPKEKKKNTATVIQTQEEKQQQQVEKQEEHEQKGEGEEKVTKQMVVQREQVKLGERTLSNIARTVIKAEEHVKTHARRFSETLESEKMWRSARLQQRILRIKEVQMSRVKGKRLAKGV
jgi:CRP-like cAMP-binding protein